MQAEIARRLLFVGVGWAMMTAGFTLARWAAEEFFSSWLGAGANYALYFFIAILAVSAGLTLSASRWLVPMRYWTAFLVAIGLLSAIPLSYATIQIFPALNGDKDTLHSIKMGYPVFWTAVLVPMALFLGRKKQ
jgi:hypothetical protein